MGRVLWAASLYSIVWGAWVVLSPNAAFEWAAAPPPGYPEIWQCVGVLAVVFGAGYAIAATNVLQHWPIVFVGLAGNLAVALGFLVAARAGRLPWPLAWIVAPAAALGSVPFSLILYRAYQEKLARERTASPEIQRIAMRARTQFGPSIAELSQLSPILVVFLRHFGCPFCREALADLVAQRQAIEATGTRILLVHMAGAETAASFFRRYGLDDLPRVSDPERTVYRAFGLGRGSFAKLLGPKVWWRGFEASFLNRHGFGRLVGDGFQMPGVFVVFHGTVLRSYRHQSTADRPHYLQLAALDSFPEWEHS